MLTIFCGEDSAASRKQFADTKKQFEEKGYEIVAYNVNSLDDFSRELSFSSTLFATKRLYALENILSKKAQRDIVNRVLKEAEETLQNTPEVCIWEEATDDRTLKRAFPNAKLIVTKLSTNLWKLLDGLQPGNLLPTIQTLRSIQDSNDIHLTHFMLMRRLKELLIVSQGGQPAKLAPWQVGKLKSQARAWKPEMLESCFRKMVEIEMQTKSGTMVYELNKALEITLCFYL